MHKLIARLAALALLVLPLAAQAQVVNFTPRVYSANGNPLDPTFGVVFSGTDTNAIETITARPYFNSDRPKDPMPLVLMNKDGTPYSLTGLGAYTTKGYGPGVFNNTYQNNISIGDGALSATVHHSATNCVTVNVNTTFCGDEIAIGTNVLGKDIDGHDNTGYGDDALANLTHGNNDTCGGSSACSNVTTANYLTGWGVSACQNITTTLGPMTCIGTSSLQNAGSSSRDAAVLGHQAFLNATTATYSAGVGDGIAFNATTVSSSAFLGHAACAGSGTTLTLSNVICLGSFSGPASGNLANALWVGGTTPLLYGNLTTNSIGINTSTLVSGALLTVPGMIAINQVTFTGTTVSLPTTSIGVTAVNGMNYIGITGSSYDFVLNNGVGLSVIRNPTGTQNAIFSGLAIAPAFVAANSPPTLTGTCTTGSQAGGNTAGKFTATCTAQTVILTFATTAPAGWTCNANDNTTPADNLRQTSYTTTSCTLTGTTAASDAVTFSAIGW